MSLGVFQKLKLKPCETTTSASCIYTHFQRMCSKIVIPFCFKIVLCKNGQMLKKKKKKENDAFRIFRMTSWWMDWCPEFADFVKEKR